jgi:hypothetical protein
MRLVRTPHAALGLVGLALGLSSCFGHHTSDEEVLKNASAPNEGRDNGDEDIVEEDNQGDDPATSARDAGTRVTDAGRARDAGANAQCAQMTDPIAQALCNAGNGSIDDIINGILGGGMSGNSCAGMTDPIALLLCQATGGGGTGIEGIINGLFGGRDAGTPVRRDAGTVVRRDAGVRDAGVRDAAVRDAAVRDAAVRDAAVRVDSGARANTALIQAIQSILADLIAAFFGGNTQNLVLNGAGTSDKSAAADLVRSEEECAEVSQDDLLTRLVCARQAVETLSAEEE